MFVEIIKRPKFIAILRRNGLDMLNLFCIVVEMRRELDGKNLNFVSFSVTGKSSVKKSFSKLSEKKFVRHDENEKSKDFRREKKKKQENFESKNFRIFDREKAEKNGKTNGEKRKKSEKVEKSRNEKASQMENFLRKRDFLLATKNEEKRDAVKNRREKKEKIENEKIFLFPKRIERKFRNAEKFFRPEHFDSPNEENFSVEKKREEKRKNAEKNGDATRTKFIEIPTTIENVFQTYQNAQRDRTQNQRTKQKRVEKTFPQFEEKKFIQESREKIYRNQKENEKIRRRKTD